MITLKTKFATVIFSASFLGLSMLLSPAAQADPAKPGHYQIDPAHTSVLFSINHLGYSDLNGRFDDVKGEFDLNPKGKSKLVIRIKTASIDTNHKKRNEHLRSPDFFNARQYPLITFTSTQINYNAKNEPISISGNLSMHGKVRPLTLTIQAKRAANDPWGNYRSGYAATASLKRSDFGMNYMQGGIGDEVKLRISMEALHQ
ncbi:Protein yceI precursor [hydrothermal vent metagenome]|uniref:Protein yceI n=1 Tax=hydrothermal vent metagenome TaxID=652676 RepID=A0A3B1BCH9_9ZZZZ